MSRSPEPKPIRCAIYCRKSTEEGLEQSFNSLDAQREAGEAFIVSQKHDGWVCVAKRYDDGGFTGANTDRPALQRLICDIEAGVVDCVVVHRVDRLSRSLIDFGRLMETFDQRGVAFVSVTQQFNTSTSMGRLMLNVLLSFAQFEREIIAERTRDKIAASRRKGKYTGGAPVLGYDVADGPKLVVNPKEAAQVRTIFELYLKHEALLPTVADLDRRGWTTKKRTTRKGKAQGGKPFTKTSLHALLTNPLYIGKVKYKDELHPGEHEPIIEPEKFDRVQQVLQRNHRSGGAEVRNQFGALLKGLLHCVPCGCAMTPAHTTKGSRRYRYYTCVSAQKRGWQGCPSKSIPAAEIERFVVDQIRAIGRDPGLVAHTLAEARRQTEVAQEALLRERRGLERDVARTGADIRRVATTTPVESARLADLNERLRASEARLAEIRDELDRLDAETVTEQEVAEALAAFDPVWEQLSPKEQGRVLQLLIKRVDYDGANGEIAVTFRPTGIRALEQELRDGEAA